MPTESLHPAIERITFIALDGQVVLAGKVLLSMYARSFIYTCLFSCIIRQFVTVDDVRILRDIGM